MAYATATELKQLGIPADALEELTDPDDLDAQLDADAGVMDMYLASNYTLPLSTPYPEALKRINVCLAVYHILCRRGFNPEGPDKLYQDNARMCMKQLEKIANGELTVPGIVDATPTVNESAPTVSTMVSRGWQTTWSDERA